jgi:hypothetical protein
MKAKALAESLTALSDRAKEDRRQKERARRREAAARRVEEQERLKHQARVHDFEEHVAALILAHSLQGIRGVQIQAQSDIQSQALESDRFALKEFLRIDRLNGLTSKLIPGLLREVHDLIRETDLDHLDALEQERLNLGVMQGLPIQDAMEELDFIQRVINRYLDSHRKSRADAVLALLERYASALEPSVSAVLSEYKAELDGHALRAETLTAEQRIHALRRILRRNAPLLRWDVSDVTAAELKVIIRSSNTGAPIREVIEYLMSHGELNLEGNERLEAFSIPEDQLLDDTEIAQIQASVVRFKSRLQGMFSECSHILAENKLSIPLIVGSRVITPTIYELTPKDSRYRLWQALLSPTRQKQLLAFRDLLVKAAARGVKSASFVCKVTERQFTVEHSSSFSMKLPGSFDHFLGALNHPAGLGLGYEAMPKKTNEYSLKILWA